MCTIFQHADLLSTPLAHRKLCGKRFGFPEGLGVGGRQPEGSVGWVSGGGWGGCTPAAEAALSQERSSFDLIIWEGQSAFVDEESP